MKTAILVYEEMTVLDAIGPYDVMRSCPAGRCAFVGKEKGEVRDERGTLGLIADHSLDEVTEPDIVLVPGGAGQPAADGGRGGPLLAARGRSSRPNGRPRSAPARSSSAPPACSRASGRPATGSSSSRCARSAPTRSAAATSRTAR